MEAYYTMTEFLSEEELLNLSPKELAKEANKYIYDKRNERQEEFPVLKWERIKKIKAREISVPPEILLSLVDGESFNYGLYLQKEFIYKKKTQRI